MRIMYVAPRYHTNQIPIMEGWLESGVDVCFISQFGAKLEDYDGLKPLILGYSRIFEMIVKVLCVLFWRKEKSEKKEFAFRTKAGFPPIGSARKIISNYKPDLVILRERSLYNIPFSLACKRKGISCFLYNQTALGEDKCENMSIGKRTLRSLMPSIRMTPVRFADIKVNEIRNKEFFVPFVQDIKNEYDQKKHFKDGFIQVLCVARYEARKNLLMLVEAYGHLRFLEKTHLTIVGEVVNRDQKEYFKELQERIFDLCLADNISLVKNVLHDDVYRYYWESDLFVLPSTNERASIAQLEAMSCALPVVCSDTNGTACYVSPGENGYLFRDNDLEDLEAKMRELLSSREKIVEFGYNSYRLVKEKYQFVNYKAAIETMLCAKR